MKTRSLIIVGCIIVYFFIHVPAYAVVVSIDQHPSTVSDEPFSLTVSVLGAQPGQNYLRVDLYREGTTGYFGETFNTSDWYSGSSGQSYFPIATTDSKATATATLQARIGKPNTNDFSGSGQYLIKVRRYTSSGNPASDDVAAVPLQITYSFPTATPTPLPTQSVPTKVPTSTPLPTLTRLITPTKQPTQALQGTPQQDKEGDVVPSEENEAVLGDRTEATSSVSDKPITTQQKKKPLLDGISLFLCLGGIFLLISCAILMYVNKRKNQ